MKKQIVSVIVTASTLLASFAGCSANTGNTTLNDKVVSSSGSVSVYADWLKGRLESDGRLSADTEIILGNADTAESYGIDVSTLSDEGFIIRRTVGENATLIFAKTDDGVDRGVRYFANYCADEGELNVVKDEGYRIGKITISGADLSEYVIVNPEPENANMEYTATELRDHLGQATGIYPEIVTEADADAFAITFVRDDDGSEYGDENFLIKSHDRGITITGGKYRGCMYGMYTLLEDYIGIRFYFKFGVKPENGDYGQSYIYEADEITIGADEIDLYGEGSIVSRCGYSDSPYFSPALKYNGPMYNPGQQSTNDATYGIYGVPGNVTHGMHQYFLYDDFSNWDPNYVAGRNPCFTCDDLFDETYRRVIADLDHKVEIDGYTPMMERSMCCIDIAHIDSPDFCWCDDCTAIYTEDGAVSGAIIRFANKMVEALEDTPYSDIYVGCFAYYGTTKPPRVTRPDDKVIVNFCFYISDDKKIKVCANHSLGDPDCKNNKHFTDLYDQWCEITDKMFIWYYPSVAYYFANTTQDLFKIHGDMQYLADRGTYGIMALQDNMDTSGFYFLKWYMIQRTMWDADMTYDEYIEYLKEYLFLNYGDGYEYVYDYLELMDRAGDGDNTCWAGIIDPPMNKLDFSFIKDNAALILDLYESARRLARNTYEEKMVDDIFSFSRYHIAIATHTDMWLNGSESDREWYKENLDTFVAENKGEVLFLDWGGYPWRYVPSAGTFDYDINPIEWMREPALGWDDNYNY